MTEILLDNEYVMIEKENEILIGRIKTNVADLDMVKKITEYRLSVQKDTKHLLLSNIKAIKSTTKAARDYMASEEGCQGVIAAAVLIDSAIGSMIANFFISISKPFVPTRVFSDESEAKRWLLQHK